MCLRGAFSVPTVSTVIRRCLRPLHSFVVSDLIADDYCVVCLVHHRRRMVIRGRRLGTRGVHGRFRILGGRLGPRVLFGSLGALHSLIHRGRSQTRSCVRRLSRMLQCALRNGRSRYIALHRRVSFISTCVFLLGVHFRSGLQFRVGVARGSRRCLLPPVSVRVLVRGTMGRGRVDGHHPLAVAVTASSRRKLLMDGPVRSGLATAANANVKLIGLSGHCHLLFQRRVRVARSEGFAIHVPLVQGSL